MLPGDARQEWDNHLLNDPRVIHLWDGEKLSGQWFAKQERRPGFIQWDAYYLFDRGARWDDQPAKLLGSGRTVIGHSRDLKREINPFLA
jgi:hypothetical protein